MTPALQFTDLHKGFGARLVLRGVDFAVRRGGLHFVLGASGTGKSVLIKHVVGLLQPDRGSILFEGQEVVGLNEDAYMQVRQRCQMIFQSAALFEHLTVLDNVALPVRKRFGVSTEEAHRRARAALEQVQAEYLAPRWPPDLGSGLQKRVAIARALALQPSLLLYDEPTTSLDPVAARRMDRLMVEMSQHLAVTQLVVSHDLTSVRTVAERVSFLHEGRILYDGDAKGFVTCQTPAVRAFVRAE